jgi:hypothetical protein
MANLKEKNDRINPNQGIRWSAKSDAPADARRYTQRLNNVKKIHAQKGYWIRLVAIDSSLDILVYSVITF